EVKADAGPDSSATVLTLPDLPSQSQSAVYFLKLALTDPAGKQVSSNFYWLPAKLAVLDWDNTPDSAFTPVKTFEDLTMLNKLPNIKLQASATRERSAARDQVRVSLHNPSKNLAFLIHVGIRTSGSREEILPVLWEDNYLTLMPGESKTISARYLTKASLQKPLELVVDGWNVEVTTIAIRDSVCSYGGPTFQHRVQPDGNENLFYAVYNVRKMRAVRRCGNKICRKVAKVHAIPRQ